MAAPSPAERARTLAERGRYGALATLTSEYHPLVTMVPFLADGSGDPIMVLTNLEPHVHHAWHHHKAGLLIGDTLSLLGELSAVPGVQQLDLQKRYLRAHPDAWGRVESLDCSWLRLHVEHARFDVGSGPWIELLDYATAEPDPLAEHESALLETITSGFAPEEMLLLTRTVGGHVHALSAVAIRIDRYGIEVDTNDPSGESTARIPFRERMDTPNAVLMAMAFELNLAEEREALAHRESAKSGSVPDLFADTPTATYFVPRESPLSEASTETPCLAAITTSGGFSDHARESIDRESEPWPAP